MDIEGLIASIGASDRLAGAAAIQMYESANDGRWLAALAILFILTEQILRFVTYADDDARLVDIIANALAEEVINAEEEKVLQALRRSRNAYMHAQFHDIFPMDNLLHWVSDDSTAEIVFNELSLPTLRLLEKII